MKANKALYICHLFTSYYSGRLWPSQMQHPKSKAFPQENAVSTEISCVQEQTSKKKNYVPMAHAAFLETHADYLCSTGQKRLAEKATAKLGIVLAASHAQLGDYSNQTIRVYIKLIRALRMSQKFEEALTCGLKVLYLTGGNKIPDLHLENFMEARKEIAEVLISHAFQSTSSDRIRSILEKFQSKTGAAQLIDPNALFLDVIKIFEGSHDLGDTERYTRLIPRTRKLNQQGFDAKWIHYSPYDIDRCFALMDTILDIAEKYFLDCKNDKQLEFILRKRSEYIDRKDFNRRIYAGRIDTMRGRPLHRNVRLTTLPTPQEILTYYPTVHQTYINYRYCLTAPEGKEDEVWPGVNRCPQDGDPLRRQSKFYRVNEARKYGHANEMQNLQYR